jgi:hypothetical protein
MPDEAVADLRGRIAARRWPSRELVADRSQGEPELFATEIRAAFRPLR